MAAAAILKNRNFAIEITILSDLREILLVNAEYHAILENCIKILNFGKQMQHGGRHI